MYIVVITGDVYITDYVYTLNWGGWVLETPNSVPGMHDKVPLLIGGAMPLLNHI